MLEEYRKHEEERRTQGIPALALNKDQVVELIELIKNPPEGEEETLLNLLTNQVPAGVDQAAYIKAGFLAAITKGEAQSPLIDKIKATELLGTMLGGYNITPLIACLDDDNLAEVAVGAISKTLLMFDAFYDVKDKADAGNKYAKIIFIFSDPRSFNTFYHFII